MISGRNVRLYLVDGSMTGLVTAEIMNWTGHILVAPRGSMGEALRRPETNRTGVYFLVGEDPDQPTKKKLYVGEGDDISVRIKAHDKGEAKDYWTTACFVTSKDSNLTKAHVRYLEGRLIEIAKRAGRANLANGTEPDLKALPEGDLADMEYFLEQLELLLPAVGLDFLRAQPTAPRASVMGSGISLPVPHDTLELEIESPKHSLRATAIAVGTEVTVLANSQAVKRDDYAANSYAGLRQQLTRDGVLIDSVDPSLLEFAADFTFASPSAAAAVILNHNSNGRTAWKLKGTDQTLKEWQDAQLDK
jgi:hypothetical protein